MAAPRSSYLSEAWRDGIFDGRVVFVTGGAGDICSAQTRAMVHLGADACIIGRNVDKTEKAARDIALVRNGAKVLGIGGVDVRSFDSLKAAADRCARELGAIDFVIAGAAGNFVSPLSSMTPNGFRSVIEIDTLGTFNTLKATLPYLVDSASRNRKTASPSSPSSSSSTSPKPDGGSSNNSIAVTGGRVLAVSATFHFTGMPMQSHVSAAKAAVDSLMGSVALEYGPLGVTANSVAPGAIAATEGMSRLASSEFAAGQGADAGADVIPSRRWGTVRDIADATVYVFSDAGSYVNGTTLVVDGAGWRRNSSLMLGLDPGMAYPHFLLTGAMSQHLKGGRKKAEGGAKL